MISAFAAGFLVSLGLILAIGPQNAYVLRSGLLRRHAWSVATVCFLSDVLLITAGVLGVAGLLALAPAARRALTWGGIVFIAGFGVWSARRAFSASAGAGGESLDAVPSAASAGGRGRMATVATALALTWFNPHAYLDTLVLIGGASLPFAPGGERLAFLIGAVCASGLWFFGLVAVAGRLAPLFARPAAHRILDATVAAIMLALAAMLAVSTLERAASSSRAADVSKGAEEADKDTPPGG